MLELGRAFSALGKRVSETALVRRDMTNDGRSNEADAYRSHSEICSCVPVLCVLLTMVSLDWNHFEFNSYGTAEGSLVESRYGL